MYHLEITARKRILKAKNPNITFDIFSLQHLAILRVMELCHKSRNIQVDDFQEILDGPYQLSRYKPYYDLPFYNFDFELNDDLDSLKELPLPRTIRTQLYCMRILHRLTFDRFDFINAAMAGENSVRARIFMLWSSQKKFIARGRESSRRRLAIFNCPQLSAGKF